VILSIVNSADKYITIREVATQLRLLSANEDVNVIPVAESAHLSYILDAAFDTASEFLGYSIRKANAQYIFKGLLADNTIFIPSRVLSVTSVQYYDSQGTLQTADYIDTGLQYGERGMYIGFNSLPTDTSQIIVKVVEGFETLTEADVDEWTKFKAQIRQAILMICSNLYDNRQDDVIGTTTNKIPMNSEYLLEPFAIRVFV